MQSITRKRRYVAAASIKTKIYVIGGYDGTARLNSVECIDVGEENSHWHAVAPMHQRRGLAGVCTYQGITIKEFFTFPKYFYGEIVRFPLIFH